MEELLAIFQEVEDPRQGNAKLHDLHEMLVIALLSMLTAVARAWTSRTTDASRSRGCGSF